MAKAKKKVKTDREVVDRANELARVFYKAHGYQVEEGYRFDQAFHPQERGMFNLAAIAFDFIEGTDVEAALEQLDDDE